MNWTDITVQQFLDLHKIDPALDEMGKLERAICIIYDKTEREVEEMTMLEFTNLSKEAARFLTEKIPGKAVKTIKIGNRRYAIVYNPTKLQHRQYVELMHYGANPIENMHMVMASIVNPINWFGRKLKNTADMHPIISADMLQARVVDVYHACVFFCNLYVNLIDNIQDSLVQEMMKKKIPKKEAERLVTISRDAMAGFIQPSDLRNLKTSVWMRPGGFLSFKRSIRSDT